MDSDDTLILSQSLEGFTAFNTLAAAYNLNFLFGMGVYLLTRHAPSSRLGPVLVLIAALFVAGGLLLWERGHPQLPRPVYGLLFAALLWALVRLDQLGARVPGMLKLLGDASFAIYLTHMVTIRIFYQAAIVPIGMSDGLALLLCLGFASAVGVALHLLLERPLLTALRPQPLSATRPLSIAA